MQILTVKITSVFKKSIEIWKVFTKLIYTVLKVLIELFNYKGEWTKTHEWQVAGSTLSCHRC